MSDLENPYKSPEAPIIPEASKNSSVSLSETMLRYLYDASPWLRFIGIVGFIGCGFVVLISLLFLIGFSALEIEFDDFPLWIFSLIYLPLGVLMFFPSYYTYNFGKKIRNFRFSNSAEDLEQAFKNNKSLWKFIGILCIINLSFIPFLVVIVLISGIAAFIGVF